MKEVVIISGKGGTGKTSITSAFASLAKNIVLADCDVDASNLPLILTPTVRERHSFYSGHEAVIVHSECDQCGYCMDLCRFEAIQQQVDKSFIINASACEGCGLCVECCPCQAIEFPEAYCGEWFVSDTRFGPMVHAELGIGAENSGQLTTLVRNSAKNLAMKLEKDLVLIDGPPGVGCPVIASITGCDAVVVVTEATLSGKHDLERALKLTDHFQIPTFVIINKWDLNADLSDKIEAMVITNGALFLGKIEYDPAFNFSQRHELSITEYQPGYFLAENIIGIWNKLSSILSR